MAASPRDRIPHIERDQIGRLTAIVSVRRVRPVAHVLTILGWTADGPTYAFECRASARDLGKACAAWAPCEHELPKYLDPAPTICMKSPTREHWKHGDDFVHPVYGCAFAYADAEDADDAVRDLIGRHQLRRGVHLVEVYGGNGDEVILTLLGEVRNIVGGLPAPGEPVSVRATRNARYPGYGPEVELRELIEEALSEKDAEAVVWDDDHAEIVVDANGAAKAVLAWFEERYDVSPDQRTLPPASAFAARVRSGPPITSRVATIHPVGDRL